MQLFLRPVSGGTQVVALSPGDATLEGLERALQVRGHHVSGSFVYLCAGRQLAPGGGPLSACGVADGATVAQTARLLGGKGGFGAMLRGAGRTGKLTDNFDACRDLSGRRVRHQEAEKKMAEWMADHKQRELEKVAQQHIKKQLREEKLRAQEEMEAKMANDVSVTSIKGVKESVTSGLALVAGDSSKRKAADASLSAPKRKSLKVWGMEDDLSDSDSDSDNEEAPAPADTKGKGKAVIAEAVAESSGDEGSTETKTRLPPAEAPAPAPAAPEEAPAQALAEVEEAGPPPELVDLAAYDSAAELEGLGLERLKLELTARGLKCGGTLTQRAERLFLLKSMPLEAVDKLGSHGQSCLGASGSEYMNTAREDFL
eukprot:jgi/Tetstr1/438316/TSEL_026883.t1